MINNTGQTARQKKIAIPLKDGTIINLTPNQKAYADKKMAEPQRSLASIAAEAYPNAKANTVSQIVNQNEKNKAIGLYSNEQVQDAKNTVLEIMRDKSGKARDRLAAAFDVQDRTLGKAIQRTEVQSTSLQIGIDLSGLAEAADLQQG